MKNFKKWILLLIIAALLIQTPHKISAQDLTPTTNETDTQPSEGNPDTTTSKISDSEQNISDTTQDTSDTEQPIPDNPELPEELPVPIAVKKLKATKVSSSSVLLEWNASANATKYEIYRKKTNRKYQLLNTTEQNSYVDKKLKKNTKYVYKVIAVNAQEKASKSSTITFNNVKAVQIKSKKYTYTQMKNDMKELKAMYSNYCEMTKIGTSVKGRGIYDFAIGNPDAKKSLLVVSTLHAREYICSAEMMRELEYYLENYNRSLNGATPAKVLKNMQIHYIVMANPDGVTISQTKNTKWKANGRGVDLNHNFPAKKFVVGGKRGAQNYSGPKALSEPESLAIANLTKYLIAEQNLQGVVNYHAMGQIIFGNCNIKSIKKDTQSMYKIAKKYTNYADAANYSSTSYGGQYREYVMYILKVPSITIEIGSSAAPCPFSQYEPEFQKNKQVVLQIAKYFK